MAGNDTKIVLSHGFEESMGPAAWDPKLMIDKLRKGIPFNPHERELQRNHDAFYIPISDTNEVPGLCSYDQLMCDPNVPDDFKAIATPPPAPGTLFSQDIDPSTRMITYSMTPPSDQERRARIESIKHFYELNAPQNKKPKPEHTPEKKQATLTTFSKKKKTDLSQQNKKKKRSAKDTQDPNYKTKQPKLTDFSKHKH